MSGKAALVLIALVFVSALLIRLHPTTSESFQYDAVVSQLAAREGVVANAWDEPEAYLQRRHHPPLLSYIILLNNAIFGNDPFGARIFSIVFGSLTCLAVAISILLLAPPLPQRIAGAVFGGWLVCFLPVHLYVSRTSNWDAVYGFFVTGTLLCLSLYLRHRSGPRLYAAALLGGLAFLTSELAISLVPAFLFTMLWDARRAGLSLAARRLAGVVLFVLLLFALLWPAGVFKLNLLRTLLFRWRDSVAEERNLPWHMFYVGLFRQAPAFAAVVLLGLLATSLAYLVRKLARGARGVSQASWLVWSLPFWIYVATAFVVSLKQRLVYVHHIADVLPPIVVGVCAGGVILTASLGRAGKRLVLAMGVVTIALSIVAASNRDPRIVGPQERPGFLGLRDVLQDHPGAKVYCYDVTVLEFYVPGVRIEGDTTRHWTPEKIERMKRDAYDFVVFDEYALSKDYPTAERVIHAFAPDFAVAWVIKHRRSGDPVAWVLAPGR